MAVMPDGDRAACSTALQRFFSQTASAVSITKPELRAAINAADDWADANAGAYNSAIPQPARSALTSDQKALVLAYVALRRAGQLPIDEDG